MLRPNKKAPSVTLEDLEHKFPSVSRSECQRYLRSFPSAALVVDKLQACVAFRQTHGLLLDAADGVESGANDNDQTDEDDEHDCNCNDDDADARDWRWASDRAIEQHVQSTVVAAALSRAASSSRGGGGGNSAGGSFRRARLRLAGAISGSGGADSDNGGLLRRRPRRERQPSPLYAQGIPQLLRCHLARDEAGDEGPRNIARDSNPSRTPIRDTSDHCIVHFLPALIDLSALDDPSTMTTSSAPAVKASRAFATALALYLHVKFDQQKRLWQRRRRDDERNEPESELDDEQWTIVMDVRPGHGWPNPPAIKMLGFIREAAQMLFELYPGRLHRCVVFPVPSVAAHVWQAARAFLDPTVAGRVVVVSGPAEVDSPVPTAKLLPHVSRENLQIMEEARVAAFV